MRLSATNCPSVAVVLSASALVVAVFAAVFALSQTASAGTQASVGPYIRDIDVHDVAGDVVNVGSGEIKQASVSCPKGEILVSGGFESHGTISELSSVLSVTSSYPSGEITGQVAVAPGITVQTQGSRIWKVTVVDPSSAKPAALEPFASCMKITFVSQAFETK